jgi:arylsulfatase
MISGFTATAEIDIPAGSGPAEGVICALGDLNGGWAFYLLDGRPVSCLISLGEATRIGGAEVLSAGAHVLTVGYDPALAGPGRFWLEVDGAVAAEAGHARPAMFPGLATAGARMLVGRDGGLPFNRDYEPPFPFNATLRRVVLRSGQPADPRSTAERVDLAARGD